MRAKLALLLIALAAAVLAVGLSPSAAASSATVYTTFDLVALQEEANSHVLNGALEDIYGSFPERKLACRVERKRSPVLVMGLRVEQRKRQARAAEATESEASRPEPFER
jgi:hypothetical protein